MKPSPARWPTPRASLSETSDTPRLDAELLMAEAFHIDRDRLILSPPDREVPERFWDMLERRQAGEPIAYITGRRAFWNIELHVGPGVLVPRPDSEVLIASAIEHFEGGGGPRANPRPRHRAGHASAGRARHLAGGDRPRHRRFPPARLSYAAANARRSGFEGRLKLKLGNWAEGIDESFDLILCNPPYVADGADLDRAWREYRARRGAVRRREGLDAYRALRPQLPRLLERAGWRRSRSATIRRSARDRLCSRATGSGERRARPRRTARARPANLGLRRNRLALAVRRTTSVVRAGPAPPRKLKSASRPTPDAIGRSIRALSADRNERVRSRASAGAPCPPEAKGAAHCVRT